MGISNCYYKILRKHDKQIFGKKTEILSTLEWLTLNIVNVQIYETTIFLQTYIYNI